MIDHKLQLHKITLTSNIESPHPVKLDFRHAGMKTWTFISAMTLMLSVTPARGETLAAVIDWGQRLELGPLVGGTVISTHGEVGDRVAGGSELMRIDPVPYEYKVAAAQARVEAARVNHESNRQQYERQQELYDIGSLSTVELEESSYASIRADSAYRLAQAELDLARYNLDKTSTRVPFDAWIIDKQVFAGQNLSTRQVIPVSYVVAPVGRYVATVTAPPGFAAAPPAGLEVEVEVKGVSHSGKVSFPRESTRLVAGKYTVEFTDKNLLILPGTPASVTIRRH